MIGYVIAIALILIVILIFLISFRVFSNMLDNSLPQKPSSLKEKDIDTLKDLRYPTRRLTMSWIERYLPIYNKIPFQTIWIESFDHLKLKGSFLKGNNNEYVICVHGYKGTPGYDFCDKVNYYRQRGSNLLMVDNRSHGESEGRYIGMSELDQYDVLKWIDYVNDHFENPKIYLHGVSMGGATVIHCAGKNPKNVYGVIDDCGFDSGKNIVKAKFKKLTKLPYFPFGIIVMFYSKIIAKSDLSKTSGQDDVQHTTIPILFIHGSKDNFVPCQMSIDMYNKCVSPKRLLIMEGVGHVASYCYDQVGYEQAVTDLLEGRI